MTKKLYVGNLNYRTTGDQLRELFATYGEVTSANVVTDRNSGRSRGFGFVEMANDAEANAAVEALNGQSVDGRQLKIAEAKPREDRPSGGYGGGRRDRWEGGSGGGRRDDSWDKSRSGGPSNRKNDWGGGSSRKPKSRRDDIGGDDW